MIWIRFYILSNSVLYVSGWINPYFYLDWNTWYINCNLQNSYLSLYKWNWEDLTGTLFDYLISMN